MSVSHHYGDYIQSLSEPFYCAMFDYIYDNRLEQAHDVIYGYGYI